MYIMLTGYDPSSKRVAVGVSLGCLIYFRCPQEPHPEIREARGVREKGPPYIFSLYLLEKFLYDIVLYP